jgi:SAM-dependent methyltransferase
MYRLARKCWGWLPEGFRSWAGRLSFFGVTKDRFLQKVFPQQRHATIYDDAYYEELDRRSLPSSRIIAETVVRQFAPASMIDVGCGSGALLQAFREQGVVRMLGLEYSPSGLAWCRKRNLNVRPFDLKAVSTEHLGSFDVVCSLEVGEHLPAHLADQYVDFLCSLGQVVVFSAAVPGQGGTDHINEQPHEYWRDKITAHGLTFDTSTTESWRAAWKTTDVAWYYAQNVMVFRK